MVKQRSLSSLILVFLSILAPCLAANQELPNSDDLLTKQMRTKYFIVRYDPTDSLLAELTARKAQRHLERISKEKFPF